MTIRGGVQRLEDSIPLKECCVSGVPVGQFSVNGWRELHLELRLKECVLPLDSHFRVRAEQTCLSFTSYYILSSVRVNSISTACIVRAPLFLQNYERETD